LPFARAFDIIADIDDKAREIILTIHWRGGQHSQLRVRKPKSGGADHRITFPWQPICQQSTPSLILWLSVIVLPQPAQIGAGCNNASLKLRR